MSALHPQLAMDGLLLSLRHVDSKTITLGKSVLRGVHDSSPCFLSYSLACACVLFATGATLVYRSSSIGICPAGLRAHIFSCFSVSVQDVQG